MITIKWEQPDLADLKNNAIPKATTAGLVAGAEAFLQKNMPKRFTPRAYAKYGWPPVSKKYAISKASKKGHQKDNVWSGRFQKAATTESKVRGGQRVVRAIVSIPVQLGGHDDDPKSRSWSLRRKAHGYGKGTNAQSARVRIQRTIPEDVALVASVAGPHAQHLLATDPRFRLKRKRKSTIHQSKG